MKKKLLYILFVLTFFICLSNVEAYDESFCNGSTYACAVCNYKSDTYPSGISYAVKSNGSLINVSRDRSKLSNSFSVINFENPYGLIGFAFSFSFI